MRKKSHRPPAARAGYFCEGVARPLPGVAGTTLLELIVVLAIIGVLFAIAMPSFNTSFSSLHLSSATSAVTGAIQSTRYKAVVAGCNTQIVFSSGTTTYQITAYALSGTPPSCATSYSNVGSAIPWAGTGDGISLQTSGTITFQPNGMVSLTGGSASCATNALGCFRLSNGATTNTINISGAGNVTVTSP